MRTQIKINCLFLVWFSQIFLFLSRQRTKQGYLSAFLLLCGRMYHRPRNNALQSNWSDRNNITKYR